LAAGHEVTKGSNQRELLVPLVIDGEVQLQFSGAAGVAAAREVHKNSMAELPLQAHRLQRGEAALPTEFI
jgi:nicotinate phosphoribosyltransferase